MKIKGKITKSHFTKEWDNPRGNKLYFHDIEIDGEHKGQIGATKQEPSFLNVGQEIEVEVTSGQYGNKFKRVTENKSFGGGKAKVRTFDETKRMCRGTAIKAAATLNGSYERVVVDEKGCNTIANFVIGDIRGNIPKWESQEAELMISRQTAVHAAADEHKVHGINSAEKLVEVAEEKYKYIIGK